MPLRPRSRVMMSSAFDALTALPPPIYAISVVSCLLPYEIDRDYRVNCSVYFKKNIFS